MTTTMPAPTTTIRLVGGKVIRTSPIQPPDVSSGMVAMDAFEAGGDMATIVLLLTEQMSLEHALDLVADPYQDEHGQTVTPLASVRGAGGERRLITLVEFRSFGRPAFTIHGTGVGARDWRSKGHALAHARRMFSHPTMGGIWTPAGKSGRPMETNRPAVGTPTGLNVWALGKLAAGRREFPNRVSAPDMPHIRRCRRAGLVEVVDRQTLRLTAAGVDAVNADPTVPRIAV